ncbi:MAG TPA: YceI family protein [Anaeromyxobacteraceae bacterium]|nr:YceI family protein [Anaeromyxobacteraceae bacterium]
MKNLIRILAAAAVAAPALPLADAATWNIDPSHTRAGFSVKHLVITDVKGEFQKTSGKAQIDEQDLSKSSVEAAIATASIDTREAKRDGHLKSADFLDVEKFPEITFKSTKVEASADGKLKIAGNLTIRGTTKPVTLDGELTKTITDPWGNTRRGFSATTKVNRRDFGVSWGGITDAGPVVGDEVRIDIQAELIKDKGAAAKS